jgi:hypothetical protein
VTYHPRHDPDFADRLLRDLVAHPGEFRPLGRLYAPGVPSHERSCCVRDAIVRHRRHGYTIVGDRVRGYCLVEGQLPLVCCEV